MSSREQLIRSHEELMVAIQNESRRFQEFYLWLEKHMPAPFFEEMQQEDLMLIAHNLMAFNLQGYFSEMRLQHKVFVMSVDRPDSDLQVLRRFRSYGIQNYRAFVSDAPPPIEGTDGNLRITIIHFTGFTQPDMEDPLSPEGHEQLRALVKERNPDVSDEEFETLISQMNKRFLKALPLDRLILALDMFFRAKTRDHCQYEVRYNEDWKEKETPSMQIMLAWRNTPKYDFLYRLARVVHRHGLVMKKVNATYIDPWSPDSIVVMALGLQGANGDAAWDVADIPDFLREIVTLKYFGDFDDIDRTFVEPGLIRGNLGNLLRSKVNFIHQILVNVDPHLYTLENVIEGLCRHPELTVKLCECFEHKFHPDRCDLKKYKACSEDLRQQIETLDTGHSTNDTRRKNVLTQALNMTEHTLKTNFYRNNKTAFSFRLDPAYLDQAPFDRKAKFPELPYAIFFVKGLHFFGYHIRFKDLARGGLRTVFTEKTEQMVVERANIFIEAYNLAYTQQKKNKDIPEGGAKGIIFIKPFFRLQTELGIFRQELRYAGVPEDELDNRIKDYHQRQKQAYLYQTQRSFVGGMLTLINCEPNGKLKAKHIVDYWGRPEYIYLGPDENMHNNMIDWIAKLAKKYDYKPGGSFISSKPKYGINHKEYGVTSFGVHVYLHEILKYLGIDPTKDTFTIKMSGGPDGDVAGNELHNLYRFYPKTAKLLALTDGSGTINDPVGLDLKIINDLFLAGDPINKYPPEKLNEGGFLLDRHTKKDESAYVQHTLCWRKKDGKLVEDWISGNEMNHLFRENVHQTKTDVFVPAGGRPRTLSEKTWEEFLDETGEPTSRAIVEGANLYLTPWARKALEKKGVLIVKDSSANKGGVICSSFEVLCGLTLGDEKFFELKEQLVKEMLHELEQCALKEAQLLIRTHEETGAAMTTISEQISKNINGFMYELLDHLDPIAIPNDPNHPLIKAFLAYCLPTLREKYTDQLLERIPDHHKKAIISCHIASELVYMRGLDWSPSIVDILPVITRDPALIECTPDVKAES